MRARQLATLFACLTPLAAAAQATAPTPVANRTGFFIGFDPIVYASLRSDLLTGGGDKGGTGVSLRFGWGFSDRIALVMDVPVTTLIVSDSVDYLMSHGDIALVYLPTTLRVAGRALVPFVQVGGGFRSLESTLYDGSTPRIYSLDGEVFSAGAGARYYVARRWAITLQGWWSSGDFNDERIGNTTTHNRHIAATSLRVQSGLEWHPGRR